MLILLLSVALVLSSARADRQKRTPNILLLFPDEWRFDWDGINDATIPLRVPFVQKAAAQGTRFTRAIVASPVCAPSRSCLASGREYDSAGVPSNFQNDYPVEQTTFYKLLRDQGGYWTMTVGKDDLTKSSRKSFVVRHKRRADIQQLVAHPSLRRSANTRLLPYRTRIPAGLREKGTRRHLQPARARFFRRQAAQRKGRRHVRSIRIYTTASFTCSDVCPQPHEMYSYSTISSTLTPYPSHPVTCTHSLTRCMATTYVLKM